MHFTKHGIYPKWSERPKVNWQVRWGFLGTKISVGITWNHRLTDGSGQYTIVRVAEIHLLCLWLSFTVRCGGRPRYDRCLPVRSFSEIMGRTKE